jgi:uncharacterized protein YhbP (UPF0306 family)
MDDQAIEKVIREYLPQVIHMSLATVADGKPYVCELHYVFDDELNLYWVSVPQVRHSKEVVQNPNVAGNIVTQHHLNQLVRGISFEGTAEALRDIDENHPAYKLYAQRFPDRAQSVLDGYSSPEGRRIYKITVHDYWLIDGLSGKPEKHHLAWK